MRGIYLKCARITPWLLLNYVVFCKVHDIGSEVSLDLTPMATLRTFAEIFNLDPKLRTQLSFNWQPQGSIFSRIANVVA